MRNLASRIPATRIQTSALVACLVGACALVGCGDDSETAGSGGSGGGASSSSEAAQSASTGVPSQELFSAALRFCQVSCGCGGADCDMDACVADLQDHDGPDTESCDELYVTLLDCMRTAYTCGASDIEAFNAARDACPAEGDAFAGCS